MGYFTSCKTVYETIDNRNFADQYNPSERNLHPEYSIYMKSANDVRLYFRFFPNELTYFPAFDDSISTARAQLFFRVTNSYSSIIIIDSLTSNFALKGKPRSHFLGYVPLNLTEEGKYIIEVFLSDRNIRHTVSNVIEYTLSNKGGSESFMFLSQYGNPLFYSHFSVADTFRVRTEMYDTKPMRVSYYKPDNELPIPPDIQQEVLLQPNPADTSWIVENPDTTLFIFKEKGIYYFTNSKELLGEKYVCLNSYYPYLKTPEELFKPLSYLCTAKELKKLSNLLSMKQAVDTFWLNSTKDLDKSRELIRVFYNRVQLANYYFTDYKEGWLTDRGMIYVICGAPAVTRITDDGEYWIYGKGGKEATKFFFFREQHPIFGTTHILERSDLYSRMWYNAITTWRDGRVFSLNP
ncbi:MAG: GWxTD domain-containing protein [Salinivirgaceae bacterium]|jgi:GWxTD domain-containing protein|nr:GWxTD domain-containing protein [Salinivirgaceae bacterium]